MMSLFFNAKKFAEQPEFEISPTPGVSSVLANMPRQTYAPTQSQMSAYEAPKRNLSDKLGLLADAFSGNHMNGDRIMAREQQGYNQWAAQAEQQRRLADQFTLWEAQQKYKAANPDPAQPTDLQRTVEYYQSIGRPDLATSYLQNRADPVQGVPVYGADGSQSLQFIRPSQMGTPASPPQRPVGKLTPIPGGAAPQGAGNFR